MKFLFTNNQRGVTLIELLVTIAIALIIMVSAGNLLTDPQQQFRSLSDQADALGELRKLLNPLIDDIRGMTTADNGSYPIRYAGEQILGMTVQPAGDEPVQYGNEEVERYRTYYFEGDSLYRVIGLYDPADLLPPGATLITKILDNVVVDESYFIYYGEDELGEATTLPIDIPFNLAGMEEPILVAPPRAVRAIGLHLVVLDPQDPTNTIEFDTNFRLLNLGYIAI